MPRLFSTAAVRQVSQFLGLTESPENATKRRAERKLYDVLHSSRGSRAGYARKLDRARRALDNLDPTARQQVIRNAYRAAADGHPWARERWKHLAEQRLLEVTQESGAALEGLQDRYKLAPNADAIDVPTAQADYGTLFGATSGGEMRCKRPGLDLPASSRIFKRDYEATVQHFAKTVPSLDSHGIDRVVEALSAEGHMDPLINALLVLRDCPAGEKQQRAEQVSTKAQEVLARTNRSCRCRSLVAAIAARAQFQFVRPRSVDLDI